MTFRLEMMPNMGMIMPNMGISASKQRRLPPRGLADALFSTTQQRVLGLLFGQPDRSYYASEIIARSGGGSGAVQRELARLESSGLVTTRRVGPQKHYQANPESPVFEELCGLFRKTVGLADPLRAALAPLQNRIAAAFVFGSVAKRVDRADSDIDLMVISDDLSYAEVFGALETVAVELGRMINPTVYSRAEFNQRLRNQNAFVTRVMERPKTWIVGSKSDLAA